MQDSWDIYTLDLPPYAPGCPSSSQAVSHERIFRPPGIPTNKNRQSFVTIASILGEGSNGWIKGDRISGWFHPQGIPQVISKWNNPLILTNHWSIHFRDPGHPSRSNGYLSGKGCLLGPRISFEGSDFLSQPSNKTLWLCHAFRLVGLISSYRDPYNTYNPNITG